VVELRGADRCHRRAVVVGCADDRAAV
jgi:hypothetical protein